MAHVNKIRTDRVLPLRGLLFVGGSIFLVSDQGVSFLPECNESRSGGQRP